MEIQHASSAILRHQSSSISSSKRLAHRIVLSRTTSSPSCRRFFSQSAITQLDNLQDAPKSTEAPRPPPPKFPMDEVFDNATKAVYRKNTKLASDDPLMTPFDEAVHIKESLSDWVNAAYSGYRKRLQEQQHLIDRPAAQIPGRSTKKASDNADFRALFPDHVPDPARTGRTALGLHADKTTTWAHDVKEMDHNIHLFPRQGRSFNVSSSLDSDLAVKLRMLNAFTRNNKIFEDSRAQRFHERPGLKRKRLKRQRWRARFKGAFAAICTRAETLAKKGW